MRRHVRSPQGWEPGRWSARGLVVTVGMRSRPKQRPAAQSVSSRDCESARRRAMDVG
ncbi:hypothetical protein [Lysobacter gummosus]|uniref:hypothetical protein n=1 Tax=Lysobacter gummosus TaxID=262324 RepID=UPI00363E7F99